jgi:hypothetical protein
MRRYVVAWVLACACSSGGRPAPSARDAATRDAIAVVAPVDAVPPIDAVPPQVATGGLDLEAELAKLEAKRRKAKQPVEAVPLAYVVEIRDGVLAKVDAVPASPVKWGEQILDLLPVSAGVLYAIGSLHTGEQAPGHGVVYRRSGGAWKIVYQNRNRPLIDIAIDAKKKIHVAGGRGLLLRLDGATWKEVAVPPELAKIGVLSSDRDGLWAGGADKTGAGMVFQLVDGKWTGGKVTDGDWILSLGGDGKTQWAGGGEDGGVYRRDDRGEWKQETAFTGEQVRSFVVRGDTVWTAGEIVHRRDRDGTWTTIDTGVGAQHASMIRGLDDRLVVATMDGVLIGDGTTWQLVPIPYVIGAVAVRDKTIFAAFTVER